MIDMVMRTSAYKVQHKACVRVCLQTGLLHEYIGHDVSNMRSFDSYRLLTLSLAALMTKISSVVIESRPY